MKDFFPGRTFTPIQSATPHVHDGWEIILNISGCGEDIVGGEKVGFAPGSVICIPPGLCHEKTTDRSFEDIYITTGSKSLFPGSCLFLTEDDEIKSLENISRLIYYYYYRDGKAVSRATESLFESLVNVLYDHIEMSRVNKYAADIRRNIIENFTDPEFIASDALENTGLCRDYARKIFKNEFGVSPAEYLINLRLENARSMLAAQKHLSIAETALSCGFYDTRYFSRIFKQRTGCTPMSYWKNV